ncbi:MAG TPA: hypothetical protein VK685_09505 [Candidatus Acidoferrum sp.]|jgi:hypothetical protein|nr:hypothetical protein [Candidatus Acidoferrum sp.]
MALPRSSFFLGSAILAITVFSKPALADEIRLKDGQKLYGVIVSYEDNMFKVKTDFGFVLVEKDKIASIVPNVTSSHNAAKVEPSAVEKPASAKPETAQSKPVASVAQKETRPPSRSTALTTAQPVPVASVSETVPEKKTISFGGPSTPIVPPARTANTTVSIANAPALRGTAKPPSATLVTTSQPAKPKEIEPAGNRETLQGNMYINYTHGFQMYKPPSWKLLDDAGKEIPNAIVAMGTANESTLMVVGSEKTKGSLDLTAADVEKRLRETYGNYRRISQRKTVAGGFPAVEIHYRGLADEHDWSGTLLVVSRGEDIFSVLGMTYSDSDLIQIQENVIGRAISSLEFNKN